MTETSSNSSSNNLYYRGAIALNNIGVDLLHRHYYQQAAETLRDAIRCMNAHRSIRAQKIKKQQPPVNFDLTVMLQNANHRLASCSTPLAYEQQQQSLPSSSSSSSARRHRIVDFRIGCPLLVHGLKERNQQLLSLLCPIRVDDCEFAPQLLWKTKTTTTTTTTAATPPRDSFEYHTASFVMNLGIAYLCVAEQQQQQQPREDGMNRSVSLFELAFSILGEFCASRDNVLGAREVAQLQLAVVLGLMRAKSQQPPRRPSSKLSLPALQMRLQQLLVFIQSSELFHASCTQGLNCAGAA